MWKKVFGVSILSVAASIAPGMVTAAAQDIPPGFCAVPGPDQGNFDQQGDWQGQNVVLVPCGSL